MNTNCHKVYRQVMELEEALLLFEELQKEDQAPNNNEMKQLLVTKIFIRLWGTAPCRPGFEARQK